MRGDQQAIGPGDGAEYRVESGSGLRSGWHGKTAGGGYYSLDLAVVMGLGRSFFGSAFCVFLVRPSSSSIRNFRCLDLSIWNDSSGTCRTPMRSNNSWRMYPRA